MGSWRPGSRGAHRETEWRGVHGGGRGGEGVQRHRRDSADPGFLGPGFDAEATRARTRLAAYAGRATVPDPGAAETLGDEASRGGGDHRADPAIRRHV